MAVLKEFKCDFHGIFEGFDAKCPKGKCHPDFIHREIRTAPAFERGNKKFIDRQMDLLAQDHGLTNMHSGDAQSGTSALQVMQSKKNTEHKPTWIDIPHAAAGFSRSGDAAPVFKPESMGMVSSPKATETIRKLPKPRPSIVASYRG